MASTSSSMLPGDLSQDRIRFLEHLMRAQFGECVSQIASILMNRGTLAMRELVALSDIDAVTIHKCLMCLSVHSLLKHHDADFNGQIVQLYSCDTHAVEARFRTATFAEYASQQWTGMDKVVSEIFRHGFLRQPQLVQVLRDQLWTKAQQGGLSNGVSKKSKGKMRAIHSEKDAEREAKGAFAKAVDKGYLSVVTQMGQISLEELFHDWHKEISRKYRNLPTAGEKAEIQGELDAKIEEMQRDERLKTKGRPITSEQRDRRKKRQRKHVASDDSDEWSDDDIVSGNLPSEAFFRINTEGFHLHMRSRIMRKFCEDVFNREVAIFFGLYLDLAESDDTATLMDETSKPISNSAVLQSFASRYRESDVLDGFEIPEHRAAEIDWRKPRRAADALEKALACLGRTDDTRLWLEIGSSQRGAHPRAFLKNVSTVGDGLGGGGKWVVLFGNIGRRIKRTIIESLIRKQLDREAERVFRILAEKGFLEEKHIARLAFLSTKNAREAIGKLRERGWIVSQEVSRTSDRSVSRTIFLWGVDYDRVVEMTVAHHYKALANAQSQKAYQQQIRKTIIEKKAKHDAEPKSFVLTEAEREGIEELHLVIEALTVAQQRLDRDLFVLRYFHAEKSPLLRF